MANKVLASLSALFTLDSKGFEAGINKSKKTASSFQKSMSGVGLAIAGAFSVAAIVNFTKESIKLASQLEGVEKAFKRLNREGLLMDLRKATANTVSDLRLMQSTVMASNFNIPIEKMGILLEFAAKRAADTGQSVDYLVESIITGLGRQSVLILDNLGLSAKEISEEAKNTGDFFEAAFKIIERESGKTTLDLDSMKTRLEQSAAAVDNLKAAWGGMFAEITTSGFFAKIIDNIDYLRWGLSQLKEDTRGFGKWWHWFWQTGDYSTEAYEQAKRMEAAADIYAKNAKVLQGEIYDPYAHGVAGAAAKKVETIAALSEELKLLKEQQDQASVDELADINRAIKAIEDKIAAYRKLGIEVENVSKVTSDMANARRTRFATEGKESGGTGGAGGTGGISGVMDFGLTPEAMEGYGDNLDEMVEMTRKAADNINYAFESIGYAFADALAEFMKGQKSFSDVVFDLIADIIKIIAGYLAQSIAASYAGGASVGGPAAPFTGAAAAVTAASLFGAIVPALMASGGTVPGGFPNDTYPAMLSSGETVLPAPIPLSGSTGGGQVDFVIRGENLYGILKKQTSKESKYK